jgi:tetratricopeptide (TPR) repeat protein
VPHTHVSAADVCLFATGQLEGLELRRFLRRDLSACPWCRRLLSLYAPVLNDSEPEPPEVSEAELDAYDAVLDRVFSAAARQAAVRAEDQAELARLKARLEKRPYEGSLKILDDLRVRTHAWAWLETILAISFDLRYRDPQEMRFLAWGAVDAAKHFGKPEVNRGRYTPEQLADLRIRTLAELANAERLTHQYRDAEIALCEAAELAEQGSGDPILVGRILDVHASLRMDERKLGEALDILGDLHHHYSACGETHLAGRALIKKGVALHYDERDREAIDSLRQGLAAIEPQRDPNLVATGQQVLVLALVETADYREARRLLLAAGLRQALADEPVNLLKLRWVEGKIFAGTGKLRKAEEIFTEVQADLQQHGRDYDSVAVGLELAGVLLRQGGREAEVEELAEEALETLKELPVSREAIRAVRYLRDACRQRLATADTVQQVVSFLKRAEHQSGLRFDPL